MLAWLERAARGFSIVALVVAFGCGDDDGGDDRSDAGTGPGADAGLDGGRPPMAGSHAPIDASVDSGTDSGRDGGEVADGGKPEVDLTAGPEPEEVGTLELTAPLNDLIYVEDLVLGLYQAHDAAILDMSDPRHPQVISTLPTSQPVIAAALDPEQQLLYLVSGDGDLRAFRVADTTGPEMVAQVVVHEPDQSGAVIRGMVRVGQRLWLLGAAHLLPVSIEQGNAGSIALLAQAEVELQGEPRLLAAGGAALFVGFAGGKVELWSASDDPKRLDSGELGGEIAGWVVRGRRVFAAVAKRGLLVVDMNEPGKLRVLFERDELDDIEGLERFGNLVIASLGRGALTAIDISDLSAPRALVTRVGKLPKWIAPIGGNLLLGSDESLTVFGIPPFVSASVPAQMLAGFPRYGRIPLQLSKPVDPATVTVQHVQLRCGGKLVEGTVVVSLDNLHITFLPSESLPASSACSLALSGVRDGLGLELSAGPQLMAFTTAAGDPAAVVSNKSAYPHTADGQLTDWRPGKTDGYEYFDVKAVQGMYSRFYADFDGQKLWLLNDWFYNSDDIDPDCYNQFGVWTGGGAQQWEIRAYGDQHIEVRLDGVLLQAGDPRVSGGYGKVASPDDATPHTVYEIAIETAPGSWGVQLHDPGPTFSCHQLESDPVSYLGASDASSSNVDPTQLPRAPEAPALSSEPVNTTTPVLSWQTPGSNDAFTAFLFELASGEDLSRVLYHTVRYGRYFTLPPGLLRTGMTYSWRVTAYNLAGRAASELATFTVGEPVHVAAPTLEQVLPTTIDIDESTTLGITGTGFMQGARAYFGGAQIATTYEDDSHLLATVPASLCHDEGSFAVTVRNAPNDEGSESAALEVSVVDRGLTLESLSTHGIQTGFPSEVAVTLERTVPGTYYIVLTPEGGGASLASIPCTLDAQNVCTGTATVYDSGSYNVKVITGEGASAIETNELSGRDGLYVDCYCNYDAG